MTEPGSTVERDGDGPRGAHFVQSLDRGLAVIRALGAGTPGTDGAQLTLSEVARRTGLTRAAARRFLLTLADLGYVRTDGKLFALTPRVLELGYAFLSGLSLPEVAQPHLERLSAQVHESTSVSLLDGPDIVYVARVPVSRIMTVGINVGTRFPAHATSMGRVLLAGLPRAELDTLLAAHPPAALTAHTVVAPGELRAALARAGTDGYALVDQELEEGLRSVAVPIHGTDGAVIAAMNVSSHAGRTPVRAVQRDLLPPLRAAAGRIESDLAAVRAGGGTDRRTG